MIRPSIACHKFDLDLVFNVTRIIKIFHIQKFEDGTNCHIWLWEIFIMNVDTSIEKLHNIHQPDQFDLCQGHSSKRHFQWKLIAYTLKSIYVI